MIDFALLKNCESRQLILTSHKEGMATIARLIIINFIFAQLRNGEKCRATFGIPYLCKVTNTQKKTTAINSRLHS